MGSRTPLAFLCGILLVAGLPGCTSSGTDSSTPVATPSQSRPTEPLQTATPAAAEAASVVISGAGFVILDTDGGTMFVHDWADPVDPAVDALGEAFGAPPAEVFRAGDGTHTADAILYEWDGFLLADAQDLARPREDYAWPSTATVDVPQLNGVELRTVGGVAVGDAVNDAAGGVVESYEGLDGSVTLVMDLVDADAGGSVGTTAVYALTDTTGIEVVQLFSPGQYPGF